MSRDNGGDGSAVNFGVGLVAGAIVGLGIGLLLAPKDGAEMRRALGERAKRLKDDTIEHYRRASEAAVTLAEAGKGVADRALEAAADGLIEARRHTAAAGARRPDLAGGVDSLVDRH